MANGWSWPWKIGSKSTMCNLAAGGLARAGQAHAAPGTRKRLPIDCPGFCGFRRLVITLININPKRKRDRKRRCDVNLFDDSLAPRTRFDLNFRIGDIPVRVHPYFWLSIVLLSMGGSDRRGSDALMHLLVWVAIIFVSVLVHELGHVLMGRYFGSRGHILLTGFCGLAIGSSNLPERWQRIAVYLAGPGAGFVLAGVVTGISWLFYPEITLLLLGSLIGLTIRIGIGAEIPPLIPPLIVLDIIHGMLYVNIFWGLVNLLPVWPLDGGQVCREICDSYRGREGLRLSLQISLYTASAFAVLALLQWASKDKPLIPYLPLGGSLFPAFFFGLMAYQSWHILQQVQRGGRFQDDDDEDRKPRPPWERDADWWKR